MGNTFKNHVLESRNEIITADYGTRQSDYPTHNGIDFVNGSGGACGVIAVADGIVVDKYDGVSGYSETYTRGNFVRIKHKNGLYTRYLHMVKNSICVNVGDTVKAGDKLGIEGNTGYSFGTHLHFDVNDGKTYVDPLPYLKGEKSFYNDTDVNGADTEINIGDSVMMKQGAKFSDGTAPFEYVYNTVYTVQNISRDSTECLIGLDGVPTGWVFITDVYKTANDVILEGDTVRVKRGAKTYTGGKLASFVYDMNYTVVQAGAKNKPDYIVIGQGGIITAAVHSADLIKI